LIIAGHGRWLAAQKLGLTEVPVVRLTHLSDLQRRALTLADNRIAEHGGWNEALLAEELKFLADEAFELSLVGFDEADLAELLKGTGLAADDVTAEPGADSLDEDVPDAPAVPVSRTGDVWLLGSHRLICGDAADPTVVATLMAGEHARLCFTSPPYGNQRDYTSGGIADWDGLMRGVFAYLPMEDDAQVLVNLGLIHRDHEFIPYWSGWLDWIRTQGWRRFGWYVWDQGPGMPGDWNGRLAPSFEFIFHFNRQARKPNKIVPCKFAGQETHLRQDGSSTAMRGKDGEVGGWCHAGTPTQDHRIPDSVIRLMRHKGKIGKDIDHPAVFPVALPEHLMLAYTDPGAICYEPFCGSGTSLLAAERTERVLRAVEIAPEYVDVAIKRFLQNFPETTITLASTGQTFAAVAAERNATHG
jgi:DNA modification methylase